MIHSNKKRKALKRLVKDGSGGTPLANFAPTAEDRTTKSDTIANTTPPTFGPPKSPQSTELGKTPLKEFTPIPEVSNQEDPAFYEKKQSMLDLIKQKEEAARLPSPTFPIDLTPMPEFPKIQPIEDIRRPGVPYPTPPKWKFPKIPPRPGPGLPYPMPTPIRRPGFPYPTPPPKLPPNVGSQRPPGIPEAPASVLENLLGMGAVEIPSESYRQGDYEMGSVTTMPDGKRYGIPIGKGTEKSKLYLESLLREQQRKSEEIQRLINEGTLIAPKFNQNI